MARAKYPPTLFSDSEISSSRHDEIMLWLDAKLEEEGFATSLMSNAGTEDGIIDSRGLSLPGTVGFRFLWRLKRDLDFNVDAEGWGHWCDETKTLTPFVPKTRTFKEVIEAHSGLSKASTLTGKNFSPCRLASRSWEYPVKGGFIDLACKIVQPYFSIHYIFDRKEQLIDTSCFRYDSGQGRTAQHFFEVKTERDYGSLGDLMRQLQFYMERAQDGFFWLVAPNVSPEVRRIVTRHGIGVITPP